MSSCLSRFYLDICLLPPLAVKSPLHVWKPLFFTFTCSCFYSFYMELTFKYRDSAIPLHFPVDRTRKCMKNADTNKKIGKHTTFDLFSGVSGRTVFFLSVPGFWMSRLSFKTLTVSVKG